MTKISTLPALLASQVTNPVQIKFPMANSQGTPTTQGMTIDELGVAGHYRKLASTSHGLVSNDEGKPIYRDGSTWEVWDDTQVDAFPMWILVKVVDANTLLVAGIGSFLEIPVSRIVNGASYNPATSGYALYWDKSAAGGIGHYTGTKPADSQETADPVVMVTSVGATTFLGVGATKPGLPESHVRIVRGTGVASVDTAAFAAAKTALEALGYGSLGIHGKVSINATQNFTQPISLFGVEGTEGEIELNGDVFIAWNNNYSPLSLSSTAIEATAAKQAHIKVATGTLAKGDWFFVLADDTIQGVTHSNDSLNKDLNNATTASATNRVTFTNHGLLDGGAVMFDVVGTSGLTRGKTYWVVNKSTNDFQVSLTRGGAAVALVNGTVSLRSILANCPMEMHQVKEIRESTGGFDYIVFDDFIVDALTVNPRVIKVVSPTEGVGVKDLRFSYVGVTDPTNATLAFNKCVNVTVSNCVWEHDGPNEIWALYCAHVTITNCRYHNKIGYNSGDGYAVVAGVVNHLLWKDCSVLGCRHSFTTTAHTSNGARYATPRHVVVENIVQRMDGRSDTSLVLFDTHAEGWGIVFKNCIATIPYDPRNPSVGSPVKNTNVGFQSRTRHTAFLNCYVFSSGGNYGVRIMGDDCVVKGLHHEDGWRGVYVVEEQTGLTSGCNRCRVLHSSFSKMGALGGGAGVALLNGTGHRVAQCDFEDVAGTTAFGGVDPCCVMIAAGVTAKIVGNNMNKGTNKYSIGGSGFTAADVEITGNSMIGYTGVAGVSDSGLNSLNPDVAAIQAKCDLYNFTD